MAKVKLVAERGITPIGTAMWCKSLYEKDAFKGDESKAKFKGYLKFPKGDEASEAWVQARIKRHKLAKGSDDRCPVKDGDAKQRKATQKDVDEGNAEDVGDEINDERLDGMWYVQFTTKRMPVICDAFKRKLTKEIEEVKGGDKIRFAYAENVVEDGFKGVYLYLNGVQLLEKVNTGFDGTDAFDVVDDGYQAPEAPAVAAEGVSGGDF